VGDYKVSDFIIDRLIQWDVKRVFGYPGDAINPVINAMDRPQPPIRFIQARHEEMCAFMACAHAKFTGELGVCLSTSGPGAIHLLNGLYDAKMDNQPVLAIVGQQPRRALGTSFLQDVDLVSMFKDVAHEYVNLVSSPEQVRHLLDRSIRIARTKRCVTCLILPSDVQMMAAEPEPKREHGQSFSGVGIPSTAVVPSDAEIASAADVLNQGSKVAILLGAGSLGARAEILQVADLLGAGVAKALLGKGALEDSLPYVTGSIGMLGTKASCEMMSNCDTLFMIGSNFPYAEFLPLPGSARGVQIDLDPQNLSLRYPMDVSLMGDTAATLTKLIPLLVRKVKREWRDTVAGYVSSSEAALELQANAPGTPVNPQLVYSHLSNYLPTNAIITADSGTSTVWFARYLKMGADMKATTSGGLASMGCSIPYAIAAKFAYPGRPVIACCGDGAMQMGGNNELITVSRYWREWQDPRLVVVVLKNNDLNFVTWEMRKEGEVRFAPSQDLPDFPYADYARSLGLAGFKISSAEDIVKILDQAFDQSRPVLIEVESDGNIPPLPPHLDFASVKSYTAALAKGQPAEAKAVLSSLNQLWQNLIAK